MPLTAPLVPLCPDIPSLSWLALKLLVMETLTPSMTGPVRVKTGATATGAAFSVYVTEPDTVSIGGLSAEPVLARVKMSTSARIVETTRVGILSVRNFLFPILLDSSF
jgi:hypothetical protein